ncbi:flagellar basal body P-ring protein FlgI [Helicobacter sp. MIT 14-3879]|uniref:flagellar basal body P-ring protein FlgI n=1 Tax=Helicobacter sp. MIT 14-3879 TaxID=2040649 RepID=UPI000E1F4897|nr:flagellar basal body P-ring protein FlgI [Helicobacter sp. MIT 14-3879]RDU65469.1 flagellar biosynthesis protein FlgI [Helicobacter sp. MIT 14-3879]
MFRFCLIIALFLNLSFCAKIKDISNVLGVRENELTGYGLIIGLNGTGDKSNSKFTMQAVSNMLETMNIKVSPNDIKSKNVAAVVVSAKLPPFARAGDKIDVFVSSIGDAKSLAGGTLVLTPLSAIDGNVYAIAQGNISLNSNSPSATISMAGTIERELVYDIYNKQNATLSLKDADFKNAINIQKAINTHFNENVALAKDPRTISLTKPKDIGMVEFLSLIQDINVDYSKGDKIIIDEQNGTIITGKDIAIEPITISYGDITIEVSSLLKLNGAESNTSPTISSLVSALQKIGTTPQNIVSILNAMKKSGAINVNIEVI